MSISLVGGGYWGKNIARSLFELNLLESISDQNQDTAKKLCYDYGVNVLSFDEILLSDCKAVAIAVPASLHADYARRAIEAGKHVFVEKPLALNLDDAQSLQDQANEMNVVLMVGHLLQYHNAFTALKERANSSEFGELQYVYSNRLSLGKIRSEEDVLWSFAPHDISMVLALVDSPVVDVDCSGTEIIQPGIADTVLMKLKFQSGLSGHIFCSWLHPFKEQRLVAVGEQETIVFDDTRPWSEKLAIYPYKITVEAGNPRLQKESVTYVELQEHQPLKAELKYFWDVINCNSPPRTDGQEGIRVLDVLTRAQVSMERK